MKIGFKGWSVVILAGCTSGDGDDTDIGAGLDPVCEEAVEVACVDQMILDLSLHDDLVSTGEVSTTTDGDDYVTEIDASAGGYSEAVNNPWVYIKFTDDGAEKVEIDDETALESLDWDMSLRRFLVRLNGGSSGPSCVGAASFLEQEYDDLTSVPEALEFAMDDYYTDDCTIINDSSGLPGSPQMVLGPWWEYPGCVATTGHPHLIQLANGRIVKVVFEQYYGEGQDTCNANGTPGEDSGFFTLRWTWM